MTLCLVTWFIPFRLMASVTEVPRRSEAIKRMPPFGDGSPRARGALLAVYLFWGPVTSGRSEDPVLLEASVDDLQQRHRYVTSVLVPHYGGKPDNKSSGELSLH